MGKNNATVLQDGQLAVATVPQTGTIISDASAVDATALVQTDNGPQLCVKTVDMNDGGGGGTVDQTYDATSTNAQSGTAVAEAVQPALKNLATGNNSINILGGNTLSSTNSVAIGYNTYQRDSSVAIGYSARPSDTYSVAIGSSSAARQKCTVVGCGAEAQYGSQESIAIGYAAKTGATSNIQFGQGTNSTANSFQVFSYQMLDGTTGKIPMARLPIVQCTQAEYDALVSGGTVDSNTIYCIIPA